MDSADNVLLGLLEKEVVIETINNDGMPVAERGIVKLMPKTCSLAQFCMFAVFNRGGANNGIRYMPIPADDYVILSKRGKTVIKSATFDRWSHLPEECYHLYEDF